MASPILTVKDITDLYDRNRRRGDVQYLVLEQGEILWLDNALIADGTPEAYGYVTTVQGAQAQILLDVQTIIDGNWFPDALDDDGNLRPEVAAEMAEVINADAGLTLAAAIADEAEARTQAEKDAEAAQASALRRAQAIARVVELCGGNQTEAARRLGIDQSRVSRLAAKAAQERA